MNAPTLLEQLVAEIPPAERRMFRRATAFGLAVRRALDETRCTQRELAERMGKKESYVSRVLAGGVNVTLRTIAEFEQALGVNLLDLMAPTLTPAEALGAEPAAEATSRTTHRTAVPRRSAAERPPSAPDRSAPPILVTHTQGAARRPEAFRAPRRRRLSAD